MSFLHFQLYFLPPFHLGYFGVSVLFLFRAAGKRLSQDGLTYDLDPTLIKEHSSEHSPPFKSLKTGYSVAEVEQENLVLIEKETAAFRLMALHSLGVSHII